MINSHSLYYENKENKKIILETTNLIKKSIDIIKNECKLDLNFLNVIIGSSTLDDQSNVEFQGIFPEVISKLKSGNGYLPSNTKGRYYCHSDIYIASNKDVFDTFDGEQLKLLFNKEIQWIDSKIDKKEFSELRSFLIKELNVAEIGIKEIAEKVDNVFFKNQSDDWIVKFYKILLNNNSYYNYFKSKPIFRLSNDQHISRYENGKIVNIYLPTNNITFAKNIIKQNIASNIVAREFLEKIVGLNEPDEIAEIKETILPLYNNQNINFNDNKLHIEKICNLIKNNKDSRINDLIDKMKNLKLFYSENSSNSMYRAADLYLSSKYSNNKVLNTFLKGNSQVLYLSNGYHNIFVDNYNILKVFGFKNEIQITSGPDSYIEGLDHFLLEMNFDKALLLWKILVDYPNSLEYSEGFGKNSIITNTKLCDKLTSGIKWLPSNKMPGLFCPSELLEIDLPVEFEKKSINATILFEKLKFRKSQTLIAIEQMPDSEDKKKCKLALELSVNDLQELIEKNKQIKIKEIELQEKEKSFINKTLSIDIKTKELDLREKEIEKQSKEISQRQIKLMSEENRLNGDFKEVWKSKNDIASIIVKEAAEQIEGLERTEPFIDKFGCTHPSEEVAYIGSKKLKRTHPDTFKNIGEFGELTVLKFLKDDYYKKKYPEGTWDDLSYESKEYKLYQSGKVIVILKWENIENFNAIGRDIQAEENGEKIYFEVKTGFWIMPSEAQWSMACKMKDNYFICKVYNVGEKVSQVRMIQNPYEKFEKLLMNPYKFWDKNIYNKILPKVVYDEN